MKNGAAAAIFQENREDRREPEARARVNREDRREPEARARVSLIQLMRSAERPSPTAHRPQNPDPGITASKSRSVDRAAFGDA